MKSKLTTSVRAPTRERLHPQGAVTEAEGTTTQEVESVMVPGQTTSRLPEELIGMDKH